MKNLRGIDGLLDTYNLPKLNLDKINKQAPYKPNTQINRLINTKEI